MDKKALKEVTVTVSGVPNTSKVLMQGLFAKVLLENGIAEVSFTDEEHTAEQILECGRMEDPAIVNAFDHVRVVFVTEHLPRKE